MPFRENKFPVVLQTIILLAAIVGVYHHIINAPFLWDDEVMIVGNRLIRGDINLKDFFTSGAFGGSLESSSFYRPVQILTYAIDYRLWGGLNPTGFHITSLFLHFLGSVFLLLILRNLKYSISLSFLIVFIYAIHPIQIENVTYLSGRGDVLCHLLTIVSIYFFTNVLSSKKHGVIWIILSAAFYLMAGFTKENTILMPLVLFPLVWWKNDFYKMNRKAVLSGLIVLIVSMAGYLVFRLALLSNLTSSSLSLIAQEPLVIRLFTIPASILTYLRLLLVPFHYHMEYHFVLHSFFTWQMGLFILLLALCVFVYIRKVLPGKELLFYFVWIFVFLLPVLNIYPLAATLREHWVTFSSIAFFILCGRIIEEHQVLHKKAIGIPVFKILLALWILYSGTYTYIRNTHWQNAFKLYENDVQHSKMSFILWNNLGVEYFRKQDLQNADKCFVKSADVCPPPGYAPTQNNLGVIQQINGQPEKAIQYFKRAIELDEYELSYQNIGSLFVYLGRNQEAISILERGRLLYSYNFEIMYYLGVAYLQSGNMLKADLVITNLVNLYPSNNRAIELYQEIKRRSGSSNNK